MANEDGRGSRRLSLSILRTSKLIHRECMELFWERVVLNLDKVMYDHDTRSRLTSIGFYYTKSSPSSWTAVPSTILTNAKHVTFTLDFAGLLQSTICVALKELASWSQVKQIDLKADYLIFHPRFWSGDDEPRTWWLLAENFFQHGGYLSHVHRNLLVHLYTPASDGRRYKHPLPFKNDPNLILHEFSRAFMCDVLVDGQQTHWVDSQNSRKDEKDRRIRSMFIKTIHSNGDKVWWPRYIYHTHIAGLVLGILELNSILNSVQRSTTDKNGDWRIDVSDKLHRVLKAHPWCTKIVGMEIDDPRFLQRHDWLCRYWGFPLKSKHGLRLEMVAEAGPIQGVCGD